MMWIVLLLVTLHGFKPRCILFHVFTWQILMHCMQGKHLRILCSLQPTKMLGISNGYLQDRQRRLDDFCFQIQLEIWWPHHFQLPSPVWKKQRGTLCTCLVKAQVVSEGGTKHLKSARSKAVGNQCRDSWCIHFLVLRSSSSPLVGRLF